MIAKKPEIAANIIPILTGRKTEGWIPVCNTLFPSIIAAPSITGIDAINENLVAVSRVNPFNNPAKIVEPDLDIPGVIAKP